MRSRRQHPRWRDACSKPRPSAPSSNRPVTISGNAVAKEKPKTSAAAVTIRSINKSRLTLSLLDIFRECFVGSAHVPDRRDPGVANYGTRRTPAGRRQAPTAAAALTFSRHIAGDKSACQLTAARAEIQQTHRGDEIVLADQVVGVAGSNRLGAWHAGCRHRRCRRGLARWTRCRVRA